LFLFCFRDMSDITFKSIIKGKQHVLEQNMLDTDHGLLAILVDLGVITRLHRDSVEVLLLLVVFKAKYCITILTTN